MSKNYVVYHCHSDLSSSLTPDSTTKYQEYIDLAVKHNMKALAFSEHGMIAEWISKKQACDEAGIKYIHGMEAYCTTTLKERRREAFHIGLYAKNWEGVKELNKLSSRSFNREDNHFYYRPRISMDEIYNTSDNIIVTTACLGSPLWQLRDDDEFIDGFLDWAGKNKHRVFLEIQYHDHPEQMEYNKMLYKWSKKYDLKLIAGSDTHSSSEYAAECRYILQKAKNMFYGDEDEFDLTFKTYDEFVQAFKDQGSLPEEVYMEAIENTNYFASLIEDFELDESFKYPDLYENDEDVYKKLVIKKYNEKLRDGIIDDSDGLYKERIQEETEAFKKQGMFSYMSFMSEMSSWCEEQGIPRGPSRGSVSGSLVAYILDITDVDPLKWGTVFSRFVNEDRVSLGDIDIDFDRNDRELVFEYIESRFPKHHTAHIITYNTISDRGTIDEIGRALDIPLPEVDKIKREYDSNPETTREKYPDVFYYFDGMRGTIVSKGIHPAGLIAAPRRLDEEIGLLYEDGVPVVQCAMRAVEGLNFVKFDILGLKNIDILKDTFELIGRDYMKSHEINWDDENVWGDMITSPVGV